MVRVETGTTTLEYVLAVYHNVSEDSIISQYIPVYDSILQYMTVWSHYITIYHGILWNTRAYHTIEVDTSIAYVPATPLLVHSRAPKGTYENIHH